MLIYANPTRSNDEIIEERNIRGMGNRILGSGQIVSQEPAKVCVPIHNLEVLKLDYTSGLKYCRIYGLWPNSHL